MREFIVQNSNWEGCLVEPLPHLFEKLQNNYRYLERSNLRYVNAAVSDTGGEIGLYRVRTQYHKEFPSFIDQIASISKSHINTVCPNHPHLDEKIEMIQVRKLPIRELVATFPRCGLNLLHLDVEGHEAVILRSFPFEDCLPEIVIFEAGHLSTGDRESVNSLLCERGYAVFNAGIDAVALSKAAPRGCTEALRLIVRSH